MDVRTANDSRPAEDVVSEAATGITDLGSLEALTEYDPASGEDYEIIQATVVWGSKNNC